MTLQGDLATLDLAALLQNLEFNARTGTLSIDAAAGRTQILFVEGHIAALGRKGRPALVETLVASGMVSESQLESVQRKRRGTGRSLGELLEQAGALSHEDLVEAAKGRLVDDICELVCTEAGEFAFQRGAAPRNVFDAEERRLELALPIGPMLLEAARRSDHWAITRTWIPSDSVHLVIVRRPELAPEHPQRELGERLLERLDGTRSVTEALCAFPHERFQAYELLTEWLKRKALRAAGCADMQRLVERIASVDRERAYELVERGLEDNQRHPGLLALRARLAEELEDPIAAVEALKLLVHGKLAAGDREGARLDLERARALAPTDTALWERTLRLAVEDRRKADAIAAGERLAALFREPGLHLRARAVYEKLVELEPDAWALRRELARARIDSGDVLGAIDGLERFGRARIAAEQYDDAKSVFLEILRHQPKNAAAREVLAGLESRAFAIRRARRRRIARLALTGLVLAMLSVAGLRELAARRAYATAQRLVSDLELIEQGRYSDAIAALEEVRAEHRFTLTALLDVRPKIRELERKLKP